MTNDTELNERQVQCEALITRQKRLLTATNSANRPAYTCDRPCWRQNGVFSIAISEPDRRAGPLQVYPGVSVLVIEPEQQASRTDTSGPEHSGIMARMLRQWGDVIGMPAALPDFHWMSSTPIAGRFAAGFGKAMTVDRQIKIVPPPTGRLADQDG